ncbi:MAG: DegT/DnrJ/EryC1/StrS family aminotransferase [Actinobacteria bacterium]|nr:DegT/DnrJ/EryC1/StrS family aminotransferase [Actinomycetota bacterium]
MDEPPLHLFVPRYRVDECLAEIADCLRSGWTGRGERTLRFEAAWTAYTGLPHAHFVASGTAALQLAVRLLRRERDWRDGDEVVTTPLTFVSTNHVLLHERLRPVFADVDGSLCLDPESVAERIGRRTRAVVFVALGGRVGRYREIVDLCRSRGVALVVDAAHAAGTRVDGRHVGADADATAFSFHAVKNLPTADAGAVTFRDAALDRAARAESWLGIDRDTYARTRSDSRYRWRYDVPSVGLKAHGNAVMAALALVGLRYLDEDNAARQRLAARYDELLTDERIFRVPWAELGVESSVHLYQIMSDPRDELIVHLNAAGIFPGVHYRTNLDYPMYRECAGPCPRAALASSKLVSLPLHLGMAAADVERVVRAVRSFAP